MLLDLKDIGERMVEICEDNTGELFLTDANGVVIVSSGGIKTLKTNIDGSLRFTKMEELARTWAAPMVDLISRSQSNTATEGYLVFVAGLGAPYDHFRIVYAIPETEVVSSFLVSWTTLSWVTIILVPVLIFFGGTQNQQTT